MPTHREKFILNAPAQFVNTAVYEYFRPAWNFLSQEPDRVVVEEKIQLGKQPYHPITFIGAAHIEVVIRSFSDRVEVTCNALNKYYGYDPPDPHDLSEGITAFSHGHTHAQMEIESQVGAFRRKLEQIVKLGLGEQQNPLANEQINPTKVAQQINRG